MSPPLRLMVLLLLLVAVLAVAANAEGRRAGGRRRDSRVHDLHLEHHDDDDDDDDDDHHRRRHDHESFLGRDESRKYERLTAEESKKKLEELFGKIDANNDTKVSEAEMDAWLKEIARNERVKHVEARFLGIKAAISDKDVNSSLTFGNWTKAMHHEVIGDEPADNKTEESFNQQMEKDKFRWQKADANGDQKIDKQEFADFLYAEHSPRMKEVVVAETLNVSDINRDGKIDLPEYMREIYPDYEKEKRDGRALPKWVVKEEDHYKMSLDTNKDGVMDADEIYKWTVPEDIDRTMKETKHLFDAADGDKDKSLSKDEVLKNWETFVGHKATHFGEFAPRSHDEL